MISNKNNKSCSLRLNGSISYPTRYTAVKSTCCYDKTRKLYIASLQLHVNSIFYCVIGPAGGNEQFAADFACVRFAWLGASAFLNGSQLAWTSAKISISCRPARNLLNSLSGACARSGRLIHEKEKNSWLCASRAASSSLLTFNARARSLVVCVCHARWLCVCVLLGELAVQGEPLLYTQSILAF